MNSGVMAPTATSHPHTVPRPTFIRKWAGLQIGYWHGLERRLGWQGMSVLAATVSPMIAKRIMKVTLTRTIELRRTDHTSYLGTVLWQVDWTVRQNSKDDDLTMSHYTEAAGRRLGYRCGLQPRTRTRGVKSLINVPVSLCGAATTNRRTPAGNFKAMQEDNVDPEQGPETPASAPWLRPREYALGAASWQSRAINDLTRAIHPVLETVGRETVRDLPEPEEITPLTEPLEVTQPAADAASPLYRGVRIQHVWTMSTDEVLDFDVDSLLSSINDAADEMGKQLIEAMVGHISAICDDNGQTVDASGRDFWDVLIETAEKMELAFDVDGNLTTSILLHPDTHAKLSEKPPTPEQEVRLQDVINKKRGEWNAARRRRKLPEVSD